MNLQIADFTTTTEMLVAPMTRCRLLQVKLAVLVAVVLLPYPTLWNTLLWQVVVEVAQVVEGLAVSCRAAWLDPVHPYPLWWAPGVHTVPGVLVAVGGMTCQASPVQWVRQVRVLEGVEVTEAAMVREVEVAELEERVQMLHKYTSAVLEAMALSRMLVALPSGTEAVAVAV